MKMNKLNPVEIASHYSAEEIAKDINRHYAGTPEQYEALCIKAGMQDKWKEADDETCELVIEAAAEKLGVEIY